VLWPRGSLLPRLVCYRRSDRPLGPRDPQW
jgi:hypothetical protein